MRRILFFTLVMLVISACIDSNTNVAAFPTETHLLTATPTRVPSSLILADFPLAIGATWKYAAEISYRNPSDPTKIEKWSGLVTVKVVDKKTTSDGNHVFTLDENVEPIPPADTWIESRSYEYIVMGDGVYHGGTKIYQWPLSDDLSWKRGEIFQDTIGVKRIKSITVPYGEMSNCYSLSSITDSVFLTDVFCPRFGFVARYNKYLRAAHNETFELVSYEPGQ